MPFFFHFLDIKTLTFTKDFLYKYMKRGPALPTAPCAPTPGTEQTPGISCASPRERKPSYSRIFLPWALRVCLGGKSPWSSWSHHGCPWSAQSHHGCPTGVPLAAGPTRGSWSTRCPWKWVWPKTLQVPPDSGSPKNWSKADAQLSAQTTLGDLSIPLQAPEEQLTPIWSSQTQNRCSKPLRSCQVGAASFNNNIGPGGTKLWISGISLSSQTTEELPKGRTWEFGLSVSSERKEEK